MLSTYSFFFILAQIRNLLIIKLIFNSVSSFFGTEIVTLRKDVSHTHKWNFVYQHGKYAKLSIMC